MDTKQTKSRSTSISWKRLTTILITLYLGALALLIYFERSLLFPAPSIQFGNWQASQFGAEESYVDNSGVQIHVWSLAKKDATKTLIVCHGNGETLGLMGEELNAIRDRWNVNVVAFDFRGYGKTGGQPNEIDILSDSVAVAKWIQENRMLQEQKFIALGRSLGGASAIEIATRTKVDGLILDRTFSSIVDVAASRYFFFPVRWLMRNQFRSIEKIPNYTGPLLQMHGDVDVVVPYRFGKELHEASPSKPKEFISVKGLHHNDPWPESFWIAGKRFLEQL